jgi:hypothetical protein
LKADKMFNWHQVFTAVVNKRFKRFIQEAKLAFLRKIHVIPTIQN